MRQYPFKREHCLIELVNNYRAKRGVEPLSQETCARYLSPYQVKGEAA